MSSLFLLGLGLAGRRLGRSGSAQAPESAEERVVPEAGEGGLDIHTRAMFAKDGICVLYVGARERANGILQCREAGDDLVQCQ